MSKKYEKKKTIMKQNSLINCDYKELENFTEVHHDVFNELISLYQNELSSKAYSRISLTNSNLDEKKQFRVRRKTIEKNIKLRRRTNDEIYKILTEISNKSFTIKNFIDKDGTKHKYKQIRFLDNVSLVEDKINGSYFQMDYTKVFSMICNKGYSIKYGNYTTINLSDTTRMRGKYSKALYEVFNSKYNLTKSFTLKDDDFQLLFKYEDKKVFCYITKQLIRCEKELVKFFNYSYSLNKKDKAITFAIESKLDTYS